MNTIDLTTVNRLGLHARAAAKLVALTSTFHSTIMLTKDGREVNGKSIMGVMMLAAGIGSTVTVSAEGEDASAALKAIQSLFAERFGEDL